jgi:hypothetical protein
MTGTEETSLRCPEQQSGGAEHKKESVKQVISGVGSASARLSSNVWSPSGPTPHLATHSTGSGTRDRSDPAGSKGAQTDSGQGRQSG